MHRIFSLALGVLLLTSALSGCAAKGKQNTSQAQVHYVLGIAYLQEQDPTRALREFLTAVEIDPRNPDIHSALAQAYQLRRAYPEAERHYLRALQLRDGDPHVQNNLASLYLDMERWDDAIRQFSRAADNLIFTNQVLALTGLGYAHARKGEVLEAVSAYKKALLQSPKDIRARFLLGEAYYELGKADLAIAEYRQVIDIVPDYALAHFQLALAYMKKGDREQAASSFREVLRLSPSSDLGVRAAEYLKLLS